MEVSPQINDFIKTSMTACSVQDPVDLWSRILLRKPRRGDDSGWQQGRTWDESDLAMIPNTSIASKYVTNHPT